MLLRETHTLVALLKSLSKTMSKALKKILHALISYIHKVQNQMNNLYDFSLCWFLKKFKHNKHVRPTDATTYLKCVFLFLLIFFDFILPFWIYNISLYSLLVWVYEAGFHRSSFSRMYTLNLWNNWCRFTTENKDFLQHREKWMKHSTKEPFIDYIFCT